MKKGFLVSVREDEKLLFEEFISFLREQKNILIDFCQVDYSREYICYCCYPSLDLSHLAEYLHKFNEKLYNEKRVERLDSLAQSHCFICDENHKFQILLEQILKSNESGKRDLINFIKNSFNQRLERQGFKYLIVTDPYIFSLSWREDLEYTKKVLKAVLEVAPNIKKVIFIVDESKVNSEVKEEIKSYLRERGKEVYITSWSNEAPFHDRFWIFCSTERHCRGLVSGTSLNGIGKRISLVDTLSDKDVEDILKILRRFYPLVISQFD